MSRPAKFPAHRFIFPGARKLKLCHAYRARQGFHCVWRSVESKRVHRVRARDAKMDRNPGGNQNAVGDEQILLRNHAYGHRTIRILLGS